MLRTILSRSTRFRFAVAVNSPTFMPFADEALLFAAGWQGPIAGLAGQIVDRATMDSDAALADFIRSNCTTICHPVGTTKMGLANDPMAVVDQYCCVRGVEGLRVVDASVMPNIVRANTNLTCIMIAERVADWMRTDV